MSSVDEVSGNKTPAGSAGGRKLTRAQIARLSESAAALSQRIAQLTDVEEIDSKQVMRALVNVQLDVQEIWDFAVLDPAELSVPIDAQTLIPSVSRELMATLPSPILQTDTSGQIIWANLAACELFQMSELEILQKRINDLVHPDDQLEIERALIALDLNHSPSGFEAEETENETIQLRLSALGQDSLSVSVHSVTRSEHEDASRVVSWMFVETDDPLTDGLTLAQTFSQISTLPMQTKSRQDLMSLTAQFCERAFETEVGVSLTIGPPEDPSSLGSSSTFAQEIDAIQISADEGPCQESWETCETVYSNDATVDERWPRFAQAARGTRLRSALATPIRVGEEPLGVLNIYAVEEETFGPANVRIVEMLARAAGAAIHRLEEEQQMRELIDQLELAMSSREVIEQAKGIIMAQYRCSAKAAFSKMVRVSQDRNVRVRKVAERIVASVERSAQKQSDAAD